MREWLVCGPFQNPPAANQDSDEHLPNFNKDQLKTLGGEANPDIAEGKTVEFDGTIIDMETLRLRYGRNQSR